MRRGQMQGGQGEIDVDERKMLCKADPPQGYTIVAFGRLGELNHKTLHAYRDGGLKCNV